MNKIKAIVLSFIILFVIMATVFWFFNSSPRNMQGETITVRTGMNLYQVGYFLKSKNLITSASFFYIMGRILNATDVKSGNYRIYDGESSFSILIKITRGKIVTKKITIPEGYTIYDIARVLAENDICTEGDFLYWAQSPSFLATIGIRAPSAEGYLFPDTYVIPENTDPRDIIIRLVNQAKKVIHDIQESIEVQYSNLHQILTIASLVEKEAKINSERPLIAAVFYNRLKLKMKLDCDSTIQYGLKKFGKRLTYDDLASDTPYNTYKNTGLPPTPICNPGKRSILAALNPANVPYLFFVARNDGSHYFSKTLAEHNKAVDFYQKGIRNGFKDRQRY